MESQTKIDNNENKDNRSKEEIAAERKKRKEEEKAIKLAKKEKETKEKVVIPVKEKEVKKRVQKIKSPIIDMGVYTMFIIFSTLVYSLHFTLT